VPVQDLRGTHRAEEVADSAGDLFRLEAIEDAVAIAALGHELRVLEDREVAGDRRPGDREAGGNLSRGELAALELLKDLPASRIGKGPEDCGRVIACSKFANVRKREVDECDVSKSKSRNSREIAAKPTNFRIIASSVAQRGHFERTAMTSISTSAPTAASPATCTVLRAGLFGCSAVPKNFV
jgi:hypothetical protein